MELLPGVRFSSSPPLGGTENLSLLRHLPPGDALLARPEMVSGGPGSPDCGRSSPPGNAGSDRPHVRPSSSPASSSTHLEDYRTLRGLAVSDAFRLIFGS